MASPFDIFRRNTVWIAVLIGLSMLAFVIFGAVPDPANVSSGLVVLAFAIIFAGVGWVVGAPEKKSTPYAAAMGVLGLLCGLLLARTGTPDEVITIDGEGLTQRQVNEEVSGQELANSFLQRLYVESGGETQTMNNALAGFYFRDPGARPPGTYEQVGTAVALDRKADELDLTISVPDVNRYLSLATGGRATAADITKVRRELKMSEAELYDLLAKQFRRRQAFYLVNGDATTELPPAAYYELYRRLNESRNLSLAALPVEAFLDQVAEPSEQELAQFFAAYRENLPNQDAFGNPDPGRPGFYQEKRFAIGGIEMTTGHAEPLVEEPTEEELRKEYALSYAPTDTDTDGSPLRMPTEQELNGAGKAMDVDDLFDDVEGVDGAESGAEAESGMNEKAAAEGESPDDLVDRVKREMKKSDAEKSDTEKSDESKPESPDADASEPVVEEIDSDETSQSVVPPQTWRVVFQDDDAAETPAAMQNAIDVLQNNVEKLKVADESAETPKAADEPAEKKDAESAAMAEPSEQKPAKPEDKPAEDKPAEEMASDEKPSGEQSDAEKSDAVVPPTPEMVADDPASPENAEPPKAPTFEEVRDEIRETLIERKAAEKLVELSEDAYFFIADDVSEAMNLNEDDPSYLDPADADAKVKAYAEENGFRYVELPAKSSRELLAMEEEELPGAVVPSTRRAVAIEVASQVQPYAPMEAVEPRTGSRFVWYLISSEPPRMPQSLDEPGVRDQVVAAFKRMKARELAEARATELVEQVAEKAKGGAEQPLAEVVSGATVTGGDDSKPLSLVESGPITWMQQPFATGANPLFSQFGQQVFPTDLGRRIGSETPLGQDFMQTAFDELAPGEAGVAGDVERNQVYVVYVGPDAKTELTDEVAKAPYFQPSFSSPYPQMARELRQQAIGSDQWRRDLLSEYDVLIYPQDGAE